MAAQAARGQQRADSLLTQNAILFLTKANYVLMSDLQISPFVILGKVLIFTNLALGRVLT